MVAGIGPRTAGFSLVELLVAIAIASVLTVSVSLSFSRPGGTTSDAARLAAAVEDARDLALSSQARHGLGFDADGWRILRYDAVAGAWRDVGGGRWSRGTSHRSRWGRRDGPGLVMAPDGRAAPFRIELSEGADRLVCSLRGWEPLECV